jgi:hypothetical protein
MQLSAQASVHSYDAVLARLNRQSVLKHADAYGDIRWDDPDYAILHDDPRWELQPDELLGRSAWYRTLSPEQRRRIGLEVMAHFMKVGFQFERLLIEGLLLLADTYSDGAPERRYAMHEAIEECHHTQMFHEFLSRTGLPVDGMDPRLQLVGRGVVQLARARAPLFFVFVMGGEEPIDFVQRRALQHGRVLHPLLRDVIQTHVIEEARHLCFAQLYLTEHVKQWSSSRKRALGLTAAPILNVMCRIMLKPSPLLLERYGIPPMVVRDAYGGPEFQQEMRDAVRRIRGTFEELGIMTRDVTAFWRQNGVA